MSQLERFSESLGNPFLGHEHAHRYWWASSAVEGKSVVDIACGTGYGARILGSLARKVYAIDRAPETIELASKRYAADNIEFLVGDCTTFSVPEPVDTVVSFETLEHLDEASQRLFLQRIAAALRPGGTLIISTPNKSEYTDKSGQVNEFHLNELSTDEFVLFLKEFFPSVQLFGQRILPASWICSLEEGNMQFGSNFIPRAVNHGETVTQSTAGDSFSPMYVLAVCSTEPLSAEAGNTSALFDSGYGLSVVNSTEVRFVGGQEEMERSLSSVPERLAALEKGFAVLVSFGAHQDGMNERLRLAEQELAKQIERISKCEQSGNSNEAQSARLTALEVELSKQIDRISESERALAEVAGKVPPEGLLQIPGKVGAIEEELLRQIERISKLEAAGITTERLNEVEESLLSLRGSFESYCSTLAGLRHRVELDRSGTSKS